MVSKLARSGLLALLLLALSGPMVSFLWHAFNGKWLLPHEAFFYLLNSILLVTLVTVISTIIGVLSAAMVTFCDFPGRKIARAVLFLPLALPSYITAFIHSYNFSYGGPIHTFMQNTLGLEWSININNILGCSIVMSISLYPYIYMFAQSHFSSLAPLMNIARTFGHSPIHNIMHIALPSSKKAVISGLILVIMESIADFGTPNFFAVDTLSTGIYRKWTLANNYSGAAQLTLILLSIVMILIAAKNLICHEKSRKGGAPAEPILRWNLSGIRGALASLGVFLIPILALAPAIIPLIYWSFQYSDLPMMASATYNTIILAVLTSFVSVSIALVLAYLKGSGTAMGIAVKILATGYAIPNSVVAISIILFTTNLSHLIYGMLGMKTAMIGSLFSLIYAYVFRFIAIPINGIDSGLTKIPKEISWSAIILGGKSFQTFSTIEIAMISKTALVSALLVFTDALKELSATLIIRPFNFDTLAIKIFELVSEERYREASLPALIIFIIDLVALLILLKVHFYEENLQSNCNYVRQ